MEETSHSSISQRLKILKLFMRNTFSTGVAIKFPNLALKQKPVLTCWHLDSMS